MFDVAVVVSDTVRDIERRDGQHLASSASPFNASFIIGGQIKGEPLRLFRTFAEGNRFVIWLDCSEPPERQGSARNLNRRKFQPTSEG